ncbi:MAG: dynamin family protein, partial [Clostridiaceae bacterium]
EDDEFSIVLVGEFSAGKSTFLNALIGERLLPSFTNETTATINYLRHKNKSLNGEEGRVYYTDGTVEVIDKLDLEIISRYVSTESELGVVNRVEHLDLFLDSKFLEGNITLVDSPGLNGIADGHREVTETQIEKSTASIFMFKADQPGSETDFRFLGELKKKVKTIIFVLNKIDTIKKSEGETPTSVKNKLKESYKAKFPEETTIPVLIYNEY